MDFLICLPEMLEACMKKKHIKKGFIEAGMIDEETGMVPVFEKLMGTGKSWVSNSKKIGISKVEKDNCRDRVTEMLIVHGGVGQVTYSDRIAQGFPRGKHNFIFVCLYSSSWTNQVSFPDIFLDGKVIEEERPSGPDAEHRQPSKTINAKAQQRMTSCVFVVGIFGDSGGSVRSGNF
jgi:hypothetical protein